MKKPSKFIRKLTLTQQLLAIVIFTSTFFLLFFFGVLNLNVDTFVDQQMYDLIHRSQQNIVYNYIRGFEGVDLYGPRDIDITHIIFDKEGTILSNNINVVDEALLDHVKDDVLKMNSNESFDRRFEKTSLYTITSMPSDRGVIATLMSQNYQSQFKKLLINNIINIIMIIMGVMFMLMLVWVTYIIHPLNQIKDYINRIRRNEDPVLNIDRNDEIGELAAVLVEMNEELKRQEKLKEEMIQNISHDLKTPIATIKSYGESIKDGIYPYETLEKSVDVIIEHADRLEKKVFNLLMLNRMDYLSNEQEFANREFELKAVVEHVILSSNQIRPEIDIHLISESSTFMGLEEPWRVVLENLLDNALRYAITEVVIEIKDNYLSVYNDGESIDQNRTSQLFKAYEKGEGGQFGLGLSIVNRVVSNYGYVVSVRNIKEGVEFIIEKRS